MTRSLLGLLALLFVSQVATPAQSNSSRLTAKQLARAANLVIQLEQIEAVIAAGRQPADYNARLAKLSATAHDAAGNLPESNLKTDIATALYLYGLMASNENHSEAAESAASRCAHEKPGAYQTLCESTSGSRRDLLWAKARLHVSWAKAGIMFQKHGDNSDTLCDMQAERENDLAVALRVISALKILESDVVVHKSLGDFEQSPKLARVPFEHFSNDLRKVSADVELMLSWLPQNKLKSALGNALHSYQEGGVRWQSVYRPRVVSVSDLVAPEVTHTPSELAYLSTVPYTVAINWRQGSKYLKRAEEALEKLNTAGRRELAHLR